MTQVNWPAKEKLAEKKFNIFHYGEMCYLEY